MLQYIFIPAAIYICASLILPLRLPAYLRAALCFLFLLGAFRAQWLSLFWPGDITMLPEAPKAVMVFASALFSAVLIFAQLTFVRDVLLWAFVLWRSYRSNKQIRFPFQTSGLIVGSLGVVLTAVCMWESMRTPEVKHAELSLPMPSAYDGLKVALIPDLHLSPINDAAYAQAVVNRVNALQPDLILIVGDVLDGNVAARKKALAPLAELRAKYGVFVSPGNHEYYGNYFEAFAEFRRLGLKTLENENIEVLPRLSLVGVADDAGLAPAHKGSTGAPVVDLEAALKGVPEGNTRILLGHQPGIATLISPNTIDLHVAGHSHGGMMWGPLYWFSMYASRGFVRGYYAPCPENNDTQVYVSSGAGTWPGAMFRLGIPAEITLLTLRATPAAAAH